MAVELSPAAASAAPAALSSFKKSSSLKKPGPAAPTPPGALFNAALLGDVKRAERLLNECDVDWQDAEVRVQARGHMCMRPRCHPGSPWALQL